VERENGGGRIKELLKANPKGLTIEEVSKKLSLNRATAAKYLNSLVMSGQADLRELGRAKLFSITQRLPLTNLLSLASDLIIILDKDLFIQEANDSFLAFFRVSKENLKGRNIEQSSLASYFTGNHIAALKQALDGSGSTFEIHIDGTGQDRYYQMKCIPLVLEGGEHAVGIIFADITEMKKYQQELEDRVMDRTNELVRTNEALQKQAQDRINADKARRESEVKYRDIFNNTNDAIQIIEIDKNGNAGRFIEVNEPTCRMLQYSCDELLQLSVQDVERNYSRKSIEQIEQEMERSGTSTIESELIRKDGAFVPVEVSLHLMVLQGRQVCISVVRNITERKLAAEAIKKANAQVSLLTKITRHDILNQLTALEGYLMIMKQQPDAGTFSDLIRKEETIAAAIRRQIIFTRDYQNAGMQPPQWKNVQEAISSVLPAANAGDVSLALDTGTLEIYADLLIDKVFFNLIENSLRHGGHVTRIRISCHSEDPRLILVIEDDGIGIPRDEKEIIFTRGFGKNTGYGLFLVQEILAITGMTIRETGEPGKGTRFEIVVPNGSFRFRDGRA
jgi:PAS domain S-box-containing protein